MKSTNRVLVFLLIAGMELCYLYSSANFITTVFFHRTFPFVESVISFVLAALLTALAHGRGWRVIVVAGVQALGFIPLLWRMVTIYYSWSDAFMSQTWFTQALDRPESAVEYYVILLVIGWALVFWAGGAGLATSDKDYYSICHRFDRGLLAFFALFLIRFYLNATQGMQVNDPVSGWLIFPFILFSLLAIGVVRNTGSAQRDFLPGFQRFGVLLGFILVVLIVGTGVVLFSLPFLTAAAQEGSSVLGIVTQPLVSLMYLILRWLFGDEFGEPINQQAPNEQPSKMDSTWTLPAWLEPIMRIVTIVFGILIALVILGVILALLYSIVVWLFSKTPAEGEKPSLRATFLQTLGELRDILLSFWVSAVRQVKGYSGIVQLYAALLTWGRNSGLPSSRAETPSEYGLRLERRFPALGKEIQELVQDFNRQVYGEVALDSKQMTAARSAWHQLLSPRYFPLRIRSWFTSTRPR